MAKKGNRFDPPALPEPLHLGLEHFQATPDDCGLSLEELSEAYASLMGGPGADPYAPAPPPADALSLDGSPDDLNVAAALAHGELEADPEAEPEIESEAPAEDLLPAAATTEISPRTILEAMLFVGHPGGEPLTAKHVASLMRGVRPREIDDLVVELNENYDAERCPYRIESVSDGYRLGLRDEFNALRDVFYGRVKEARLSQAAIDVLAVVAYNQPLTRGEVEKLRNAASGSILSQLVRRGLLRVDRPDQKPREPIYYTTDRFLELFHIANLDELPKSHDLDRGLS